MRPYVLCHMLSSLDGKTDAEALQQFGDTSLFEETHAKLDGDAWLCGRVTLQADFSEYAEEKPFDNDGSDPAGTVSIHIARQHGSYAIGADTHGQILWKDAEIDGDHVIALVSEQASQRYLTLLRERGVSYIVTGKPQIDFPRAFELLREKFGIERLIVEGGGILNGAVLDAGLIDEFSLLLMPGVDGRRGPSTSFDGRPESAITMFPATLASMERLENDVLWLRYLLTAKL